MMQAMTTELTYLALTALWLSSLWIPYIVGVSIYDGKNIKANFISPPDPGRLPAWVKRANRAHLNLVEQFAPFAALVVTAHAVGLSNAWTQGAALAFFWLRVAHSLVMWSGFAAFPLRSVIFAGAWVCILVIGWQVLAA
jgi:uncharacterized MAPEG superfamily protein